MFVFTYLPQAALLAFTSGPVAAVSAALLVLSESSTIFTMVSKTFLIEDALVDTFDGTLVSRNDTAIVSKGRELRSGGDSIGKLGKLIKKPFAKFAPKALIRYFLYLPLNFIPVVGTVLFVVLNGKRSGPERHGRYFQLKEMNSSQRESFVEQRRAAYTRYAMLRSALAMINAYKLLASGLVLLYLRWCLLRPFSLRSQTQWGLLCGLRIWRRRAIHRRISVSRPRRRNEFFYLCRGIYGILILMKSCEALASEEPSSDSCFR